MKTYLECYPCVLNQALEAAKFAQLEESDQRKILYEAMNLLQTMSPEESPPVIGQHIHRMVRTLSGNQDPYAAVKTKANQQALALLPSLRSAVQSASDQLETAIRYAIAGNIIDFGAGDGAIDIHHEVRNIQKATFGVFHLEQFREKLSSAETVLYIGNNAGEIVFDRLLIEILLDLFNVNITFVVRGSPVLNDATMDDALEIGLDKIVPVIGNGSDAPGTLISEINKTVRNRMNSADLIIAKGQGNYETLSHLDFPIFYLLKVKCPVIGRDMGIETGRYMLAGNESHNLKQSKASVV